MIEMLGELLQAFFGLVLKKDFAHAEEKLNEAYISLLRKDASFFQQIPADHLTHTLLEDHNYTHGHLEILAELLNAEGALRDARKQYDLSLGCYDKALRLFRFMEETDRTYSPMRLEKMEKIENRIAELRT